MVRAYCVTEEQRDLEKRSEDQRREDERHPVSSTVLEIPVVHIYCEYTRSGLVEL